MKIKSSMNLVSEALSQIKTFDAPEVKTMFENNSCNLIDIRDIRELLKSGTVEGSIHIPRGMLEFWLDPESPYYKQGKIDNKKTIMLFCAAGSRSALAAKTLQEMGFDNVAHVKDGFQSLQLAGFKIKNLEK